MVNRIDRKNRMPETPLTDDHAELYDNLVARRYFDKFERITGHLARVAAELETEGRLTRLESRVLGHYATRLSATFRALSYKYLMTGRTDGPLPGKLTFDRHESGFPVAQELMVMANDAQQATRHLAGMPSETELKDRMIRAIVGFITKPSPSCRNPKPTPCSGRGSTPMRNGWAMRANGGSFWSIGPSMIPR
jgi:hypothetical protein